MTLTVMNPQVSNARAVQVGRVPVTNLHEEETNTTNITSVSMPIVLLTNVEPEDLDATAVNYSW